jgi:ectoine hydroxylase-related dioxygenase (phytanoyl-CoA dioxygenase family)
MKLETTIAQTYERDGYAVLPGLLPSGEVAELRDEATAICRGLRGEIGGVTPPAPGDSDDDVLRRYLCIHFPHKASEVMHGYLAHPGVVDALTQVIGPDVKAMQSMLFIKPSGKPGQAWHQDEYFIPTRDRSLTGTWIAMDDATVDNGCLWVIPGSHAPGVLYPQRDHGDTRFDCAGEAYEFPYSDEDAVPVEMEAGSVVLFNGYLLHRSLPNTSGRYRRALACHYMSASSLLPWYHPGPDEGMANTDMRDIVMVAGHDPYAWKGITDLNRPHVRPSGDGGCGSPERNQTQM